MTAFRFMAVLLAGSALALGAPAETGTMIRSAAGFTTTLSDETQTAAGLVKLTDAERAVVDELVTREITFARQGHVTGFAGTFISRRTPDERKRAGLDRLTEPEQAKLNALVAAALAAQGGASGSTSRFKHMEAALQDRLKVHGEISFTYGWGSGGSFRGGSLYTTITDPQTGISLGLGYAQYSGNGWWGDDCFYYSPYYYSPWRLGSRDFRGGELCPR